MPYARGAVSWTILRSGPGVTPTARLNTRVRCAWSQNPHAAATAAGGLAGREQRAGARDPQVELERVRRQPDLRAERPRQLEAAEPGVRRQLGERHRRRPALLQVAPRPPHRGVLRRASAGGRDPASGAGAARRPPRRPRRRPRAPAAPPPAPGAPPPARPAAPGRGTRPSGRPAAPRPPPPTRRPAPGRGRAPCRPSRPAPAGTPVCTDSGSSTNSSPSRARWSVSSSANAAAPALHHRHRPGRVGVRAVLVRDEARVQRLDAAQAARAEVRRGLTERGARTATRHPRDGTGRARGAGWDGPARTRSRPGRSR